MASRIAKECSAIQRGTGDKIGNVLMAVTAFISGFVFSFYLSWLMTLILLGALPFIGILSLGTGMSKVDGFAEIMRAYYQSAGYAE